MESDNLNYILSEETSLKSHQNSNTYESAEPMPTDQTEDPMDEALAKAGGLGRYQIFSLIFGICLLSNNCFLIYNIPLFEAYPAFECL